ncbi:MAG: hypothetical protein AB1610_05990 [Nitrospirota bacterium]
MSLVMQESIIKNIFLRICIVFIFIFLSSCAASQLDLSLDFYLPQDDSQKQIDGVLGVDEFIDLRPQACTSDAKKWIGFIPGVFWLTFVSEIPDTYTGFSTYNSGPFNMAFSYAIYKNIKQSRIFKQTVFLPEDKYAPIDYRLEGVINRTLLKETGYYYGSGVYAWVTRIFGLPYVSYEINIDLTLRLRRMDTNEIIWTYELKGNRVDKYYSIYQLSSGKEGKHILSYNIAKILEEHMPSIFHSIREVAER